MWRNGGVLHLMVASLFWSRGVFAYRDLGFGKFVSGASIFWPPVYWICRQSKNREPLYLFTSVSPFYTYIEQFITYTHIPFTPVRPPSWGDQRWSAPALGPTNSMTLQSVSLCSIVPPGSLLIVNKLLTDWLMDRQWYYCINSGSIRRPRSSTTMTDWCRSPWNRFAHWSYSVWQRLRSATQQLMAVPRHRLSMVGRRAFAVHGPMVWNSLPDNLRAQQDYVPFKQGLKTWLFSRY